MVSRGLADTSLFIARESGRTLATERLPDSLAASVITIGELRTGVLAASDTATRDRRLATLLAAQRFGPVPIDEATAEAWAVFVFLCVTWEKRCPSTTPGSLLPPWL